MEATEKRKVPVWFLDGRFWTLLFIVAFWPAVMLGKFVGLAVLLVVVVGGALAVHAYDRHAEGSTARR
jgi:hypothetical protein